MSFAPVNPNPIISTFRELKFQDRCSLMVLNSLLFCEQDLVDANTVVSDTATCIAASCTIGRRLAEFIYSFPAQVR